MSYEITFRFPFPTLDRGAVERAVHMIILGKCLERIGDLATNIAEYVLFIVKGVNVKTTCQRM